MPHKPNKPCSYPGCPKLCAPGHKYCPNHEKQANKEYDTYMRDRSAREFYHSRQWQHKRENFLIEHPFCEQCHKEGRLTRAQMVDHIIPIKQGGSLLDDDNLQALCNSCHTKKSIKEGSRFGATGGRGGQNL